MCCLFSCPSPPALPYPVCLVACHAVTSSPEQPLEQLRVSNGQPKLVMLTIIPPLVIQSLLYNVCFRVTNGCDIYHAYTTAMPLESLLGCGGLRGPREEGEG